jgi:hypothetical protein
MKEEDRSRRGHPTRKEVVRSKDGDVRALACRVDLDTAFAGKFALFSFPLRRIKILITGYFKFVPLLDDTYFCGGPGG